MNSVSDLFHENVPDHYIRRVFDVMEENQRHRFQVLTKRSRRMAEFAETSRIPQNVWMGVSIENADYTSRIADLRRVRAVVRFLSLEPLLGPIPRLPLRGIHWVIMGGESGPHARPMDPAWVRSLRDQCVAAGVPFFFKQWGGTRKHLTGRVLDGRTWDQQPQDAPGGSQRGGDR